ncbi:hypothetical protein D3C76_1404850 [compost metagenome]
MHQTGEALACPRHGPLQHLQVAIRVAKGEEGAATYDAVYALRLADAIVVVHQLGQTLDAEATRLLLEAAAEGGAYHLLGGDAVHLLGEGAHEDHLAP